MDTQQERLLHLDHALLSGENICSSEGMLRSFPSSFKTPFCINGVGVVVCRQGSFLFSLNAKHFSSLKIRSFRCFRNRKIWNSSFWSIR